MKRIVCFLITLLILLNGFSTVLAINRRASQLGITKTKSTADGMENLKFFAINGNDNSLDFYFWSIDYEGKNYIIFSLEDPFSERIVSESFPSYLDEDLVKGVIALASKLDTKSLAEFTGVNATNNEFLAGVQVAIWKIVSPDSQKFKLDPGSIRNAHIVEISDWLIKSAQELLDKKPVEVAVSRYFLPRAEINVNTSNAEGVVEGQFNFYGPYTVESPDLEATVVVDGDSQFFSLTNNVGGTVIESLRINEPFYVRFDKSYTSNIEVNLVTETNVPLYYQAQSHIFMFDNYEVSTTQLIIGNSDTAGTIVYTKTDSVTDAVIPGVVLEIRDDSGRLVTTMTTDAEGVATSPLLQIGEYKIVEINAAPGYMLDDTVHSASVQGSGQIVRLASKGKASVSFVTFLLEDKASGGPVGGSVFEILDNDGEVVTKIGFNSNGRCANIQLPADKYTLKEILTDPNYELLIERIDFTSTAGEVTEVKIKKSATFSKTTFVVTDDANVPVRNCVLELYLPDGSIVAELKADNDGKLTIGLPPGSYYIKQSSKGNFYSGQTYPFSVDATNVEKIVNIGVVKFDAQISGAVYDTSEQPIAGVSLVAVDDLGNEYSTASTNFEGLYVLPNLPKGAVILVTVYKAPFGFSGEGGPNKVITSSLTNNKNLILKTLEEVNNELPEEQQLLKYPFYELQSEQSQDMTDSSSFGFGGSFIAATEPESEPESIAVASVPEPSQSPQPEASPDTEAVSDVIESDESNESSDSLEISEDSVKESGPLPLPAIIAGAVGAIIIVFLRGRAKSKRILKTEGSISDDSVTADSSEKVVKKKTSIRRRKMG